MQPLPSRTAAVVALVVLGVSLAGCRESAEERLTEAAISAASGQDVEIDKDGERMTITTDEGEINVATGDGLELPEAFPKDVYLPADFKLQSVLDMAGTQVLSLETPGEPMAVFEQAREAMQAQGWKQTMAMQNDENSGMLAFEKGERNAVVSVNAGEDGQVQLGLQFRERQ